MSKKRTITKQTLAYYAVVDVLDEQTGNLTGNHFRKDGANKKVRAILTEIAKVAVHNALIKPALKPDFSNRNWRKDFATAVEKAMIDQGIEKVFDQYIYRLQKQFPKAVGDRATVRWAYCKIATYAGQVATMLVYNLDPKRLSSSYDEKQEEMLLFAQTLKRKGVPVIIVPIPDARLQTN